MYLSDVTVTNISKSFSRKMAAKTDWRRYGRKLRHCHPRQRKRQDVNHLLAEKKMETSVVQRLQQNTNMRPYIYV